MPKQPSNTQTEDSLLTTAAKAVGRTAGKLVSMVGSSTEAAAPRAARKKGRLTPKTTSRLPRKQKKETRKRAGSKAPAQ